ncbi:MULTISPECIES: DUF742 domain-containing protein [Streptomyces]|uniref:DUF742 domain-containing protein n=1 Tax=Streptomyces TaxID=1883 RepID=UPI002884AA25|nr:DUF742 domain-containing protein [Streptomyces sp. DSM 41859]MDT0424912.1 DUF742 domain-containing protein [Streptomyces sp. DSM 41859]
MALVSAVPPPGDPGPGGPAGAREPDRPRGTAADRGGGPRTGPDEGVRSGQDEGVRTGPDAGTGGADPGESASTTAPAAPPWPLPPEQDALLTPEHVEILALCGGAPQSVAEIAAGLDLAIGVVRVLVSDLAEAELVTVTRPVPPAELPDESVLRDVIEGLRAL